MKQQKGISFTLTIVVVGVVLLLAALFLIAILGEGLGGTRGSIGDQQTANEVRDACNQVANRMSGVCQNTRVSSQCGEAAGGENYPATQQNCGWQEGPLADTNIEGMSVVTSTSGLGDQDLSNDQIMVDTSEGEFDCISQGYISDTTCG